MTMVAITLMIEAMSGYKDSDYKPNLISPSCIRRTSKIEVMGKVEGTDLCDTNVMQCGYNFHLTGVPCLIYHFHFQES